MSNGIGFIRVSKQRVAPDGVAETIVASSKPFSGGDERACRGGIYRATSVPGKPSSIDLIDGPSRGDGYASSRDFASTPTPSGKASIARPTERISTRPVEKGGKGSRDRQVKGRADDEGPPCSRRAWTPLGLPYHRGKPPRHRARRGVNRGDPASLSPGRQGLQQPRVSRPARREEVPGGHSLVVILDKPARLRPRLVQGEVGGRVHLQPAQAGKTLRDALREDASELRSRRCARVPIPVASTLAPG